MLKKYIRKWLGITEFEKRTSKTLSQLNNDILDVTDYLKITHLVWPTRIIARSISADKITAHTIVATKLQSPWVTNG